MPQVRPELRGQPAPTPATSGRHTAFGRGDHPHPRQAASPLTSGRAGRRRARHPRPEPAQCGGGQALLQEAAPRLALHAAGGRDRQAEEPRRGRARGAAPRRAPSEPPSQRPGGELAPPDPAPLGIALRWCHPGGTDRFAMASDAAVQVGPPCPAAPVHSRTDPRSLPAISPSHGSQRPPGDPDQRLPGLARGDVHPNRPLSTGTAPLRDQPRPDPINATVPAPTFSQPRSTAGGTVWFMERRPMTARPRAISRERLTGRLRPAAGWAGSG